MALVATNNEDNTQNVVETIFMDDSEDQEASREGRRTIAEATTSIRLLYLQDPLDTVTQDVERLVEEATQDWPLVLGNNNARA